MPSAMSSPSEPDEITSISPSSACRAPMRMIEPLPKARSIWLSAASSAFPLSILAALVLDRVLDPARHARGTAIAYGM